MDQVVGMVLSSNGLCIALSSDKKVRTRCMARIFLILGPLYVLSFSEGSRSLVVKELMD